MIIIEGMDNTGKSTLLDKLADLYSLTKVRLDNAPTATESEFRNYLWFNLTRQDQEDLIFDRFLLSELIYGPVLRDKIRLDGWECEGAFHLLAFKKPIFIYCHRPMEEVMRTFEEREQLDGVKENAPKIFEFYDYYIKELERLGVKVYRYDYQSKYAFLNLIRWIDRQKGGTLIER